MTSTSSGEPYQAPAPAASRSTVTVVCVDDDPGFLGLLERRLDDVDDLAVRTETDPTTVADRLHDVDCVVSDYEMPVMDGHDLFAAVRNRDGTLPFVLLTSHDDPEVVDPVLSERGTDYVRKGAVTTTADPLARRVRTLVARHRSVALARQTLAALETAQAGVAVAGPDGRLAFVDRTFERRLGHGDGDLSGVQWRALYTDEEVARIESSLVPAVEDGWRWSGTCDARHADGSTVVVPLTATGLSNGSIVFALGDDG